MPIGWLHPQIPTMSQFNVLRALKLKGGLCEEISCREISDLLGKENFVTQKNLDRAIAYGWIRKDQESKYHITEKGEKVLGLVEQLYNME